MNGYDLGGRPLRVDHAEPEKRDNPNAPPIKHGLIDGQPVGLPTGTPVPAGMTAVESITQTLATMPADRLLDIMGQMKSLVTTSPEQARGLLNSNPQLSYALFQAMLMMKVVDQSVLQRMLQPTAAPVASTSAAPQPQYGAPQPQQSLYGSAAPPAAAAGPSPEQLAQQQALKFALEATPAQIAALPPAQQSAIMQIRQMAGR